MDEASELLLDLEAAAVDGADSDAELVGQLVGPAVFEVPGLQESLVSGAQLVEGFGGDRSTLAELRALSARLERTLGGS